MGVSSSATGSYVANCKLLATRGKSPECYIIFRKLEVKANMSIIDLRVYVWLHLASYAHLATELGRVV